MSAGRGKPCPYSFAVRSGSLTSASERRVSAARRQKQFAAVKVGRQLSSGRAARGNRAAGISEVNSFLSIKRVRLTAAGAEGAEEAQRVMTAQASAPPPRPLRLRR